jgi:hypothetical protein
MEPEKDFARFSKLHAWYNHLPPEGIPYLIFPWRGEQPKTHFDPQVSDDTSIHWWAWDARDINEIPIHGRAKDIIMRNPVYFNCALRGVETSEGGTYIEGIAAIEKNYPDFETTLRAQYPEVRSLERIFRIESARQIKRAELTATIITSLLEEQAPAWLRVGAERDDELRRSGGGDDDAAAVCGRTPPSAKKKLFRRAKSAMKLK